MSSRQSAPSRGVSHEREAVESSQEHAPDLDRPVCRRRAVPQWPACRGGGEAADPMPRAPKKAHETSLYVIDTANPYGSLLPVRCATVY